MDVGEADQLPATDCRRLERKIALKTAVDTNCRLGTISIMATTESKTTAIPPELMLEMQRAAERATKGRRDSETMRQAAAHMDQISEQIRNRNGVLDIGTQAIRDLREAE